MTINHRPTQLLKKIAPPKKLKRLVSEDLSLKRAVLSMFDGIDFIDKGYLATVALKVIKEYKERYKEERAAGKSAKQAKSDAVADRKQMVHRIQSALVFQISAEIRDQYAGEYFIWLPSSALEPDPEHQLKYGKKFQIGVDELPGERFGCKCGMKILVREEKLAL